MNDVRARIRGCGCALWSLALVVFGPASPAMAQAMGVPRQVPPEVVTGRPGVETPPPPAAGQSAPIQQQQAPIQQPLPATTQQRPTAQQQAAIGDVAGGRAIPDPIVKILGNPHIDPDIAYILWQLSRRTMDQWTVQELGFVGQLAPTLVEAALPINQIQMLYQFWGLDPNDVFHPSLGANWQAQSTAFNPYSAANVAAISTSDCQVDVSQMLVGTFRACLGGGQ